jgi:hypothetical protein
MLMKGMEILLTHTFSNLIRLGDIGDIITLTYSLSKSEYVCVCVI